MADTPKQDRDAGLPRERLGSRFVTAYSPELGLVICERIAEGETLKAITAEPGMPHRQTFHRWVVNQPKLAQAYRAARELSSHSLEEEALDLGRAIVREQASSQQVRAYEVAMNQLRWSAGKRNPREYSERGAIQVTVPIQINTSLDMGGEAQLQGTADHPNIYELEAKVTAIPEEKSRLLEGTVEGDQIFVPTGSTGKPRNTGLNSKKMKAAREKYKREHGEDK